MALEEVHKQSERDYKHRAILVLDGNKDIVGKLSHIALMRGLESGYKRMEATFDKGVLKVTLPKVEEAKKKEIEVKVK